MDEEMHFKPVRSAEVCIAAKCNYRFGEVDVRIRHKVWSRAARLDAEALLA